MAVKQQPAWQKAYLNQPYQPATPPPPKPSFQVGSMPQPQYKPPEGMQEAAKSFQPSLYGQQPAAQPATTTMQPWMTQPQTQIANSVMAQPKPTDGLEPYMKAYLDSVNKPVTPFTYDPQNDPAYQSQKAIIGEDLRKASATARVNAGAIGMRGGGLQNNQLSQLAQQSESRLQNEIIPGLKSQAYGEYQDTINRDRNKNSDLMSWIDKRYGMNKDEETSQRNARLDERQVKQDTFTNDLATKQENRLESSDKRKIQQEHLDLADKVSNEYGVRVDPKDDPALVYEQVKGLKTVAQKNQEAAAQKAVYDNAWNQFKEIGRVTAELAPILGLPEGTTTQQAEYQKGQLAVSNRNASNSERSTSNAQSNSSSTRSNAEQNRLISIWHSQGTAPAGIDGVAPGTPYTGQIKPETTVPKIDSKASTSLASEARQKISGGTGVDNASAKRYVEAIKDQLSDVDYRAIIKWVDDQYGS